MIHTSTLKKQLSNYYERVETFPGKVLRCQKMYNNKPYQYIYFNYANDLNNIDIEQYSKQLLSNDYYSHAGMMQWNYYLAFIIEKNVDPDLRSTIERNEDYARKYVIDYKDIGKWLNQINGTGRENVSGLSEDLADIWRGILEKNNLECVASDKTPITKGVRNIIGGVYHKNRSVTRNKKQEKHVTDLGNIQSIDLGHFREYPKSDKPFNFGKVNLIEGANGFGKTSLLEGIEYLLSGETARSEARDQYKICGVFDKIEKLESSPKKFEILRERDRAWYGGASALIKSNLNNNFNRYTFFNTDAAFRLTKEKDQGEVVKAFQDIALGEELNNIKNRIDKYKSKLESENRSRTKDIDMLQKNVNEAKSILNENNQLEKSAEKSYLVAQKSLHSMNWNRTIPKSVNDDLDTFCAELSEVEILLNSIIKDLNFLKSLSKNSISKEKSVISSILDDVSKCKRAIKIAKSQNDELENLIQSLESSLVILKKLSPYYSKKIIGDIVGLSDKIAFENGKIAILEETTSKYQDINILPFIEQEMNIEELIDSLLNQKEIHSKKLEEYSRKIEDYEKTLSDLQSIESQIKYQGLEYLKLNPDACECPMCKAKYTSSANLRTRIDNIGEKFASSNILTDMISNRKMIEEKYGASSEHINSLRNVKSVVALIDEISLDSPLSTSELLSRISKYLGQLDQHKDRLSELMGMKEKFALEGLGEEEYHQLNESLPAETDFGIIKDETQLQKKIEKVQKQLSKALENFEKNKITIADNEERIENMLMTYDREVYESADTSILKDRNSNLEYYLNELDNEYILKIAESADLRIFHKEVERHQQLMNKIRDEKKHKAESGVISKSAKNTIEINEPKISKLSAENKRLMDALQVFSDIANNYSEDEYFEKFIADNRKEIQDIFIAIHSPNEFSELSLSAGKIELIKNNSVKVGVDQISSGQRSALALSVFLALNNKLKNGPDMMIFDDPVSFTDDLNILSFIDYLRQITISNKDRQVFFATANENVAFLFRKKFEMLGDDFKRISLER